MAFRFNLQKVLDYREQLEEEAKIRLAKAQTAVKKGEERFNALKTEIKNVEDAAFGKMMNPGERWLHDQYLKGLYGDINEAALQLRMLRQMAEEARKTLAARAIDRKLLDKLKEKKKNQYNKAEQKQEQNFNDEIATIRYKAPAVETGSLSDSAGLS